MNNTMYLVTGAAGFLGSTICRQLIDRGEKVRAFVLPNDKAIKFVPKEAKMSPKQRQEMMQREREAQIAEANKRIAEANERIENAKNK